LESATPRTKIGSNDVNNTPKEVGFAQYVWHKDRQKKMIVRRKMNITPIIVYNMKCVDANTPFWIEIM
jgi:hypothetical protein